jgi:hypothetical protein
MKRQRLTIFEIKEIEEDVWVLNIRRRRRLKKAASYLCPNIISFIE